MSLSNEIRLYWPAAQAVRLSSNGKARKVARQDVEELEGLALHVSSARVRQGALAGLEAATRAANPAARKAAVAALLNIARWPRRPAAG